jgi:hypothetical protein
MNTAIAQHLNVPVASILEVQEWARVLWVRVKGLGARFVSKKVVKMAEPKTYKFGQGGNIAIATPAKYDYLDGQGAVDVYEVQMPGNFQRVKAADFLAGVSPAVIAQLDTYEVM